MTARDMTDRDRGRKPGPETGSAADYGDLLARLNQTLEDAGIFVAAEVRDRSLFLSGEVDSVENRQAALDVATALAEPVGLTVEDAIDVMPLAPEEVFRKDFATDTRAFGYLDPDRDNDGRIDAPFEDEPDFNDEVGTTDSEASAAEAIPYFPPTDPVVTLNDAATESNSELTVTGGFAGTAMDDNVGDVAFATRNDDDITQAVLRELAEDALTTDLPVQAHTVNGVVTLRGRVQTLEDAENAEAVAARVGGVREVREELEVASVEHSSPDRL